MREVIFGRSGLRVSEYCLGSMTFGTDWPWGATADEPTCRQIYRAYREEGGNFVDTANLYTEGEAEQIVGRLVAPERDQIVLATKFTLPHGAKDANSGGGHRKSLRRSLETSLRQLGVDYVDLLWVHAWDQRTPVEETLRAVDDAVAQGKVLNVGVSNTPAWVVSRSQTLAEVRGWTPYCGLQVEYSLGERTPEREFLPLAKALDLAVTAWSPLGRGRLVGKPASGTFVRAAEVAGEVAAELGVSMAQVALAWVRSRGVIPVLGVSGLAQMEDNLASLDVELDDAQRARLDEATRVDLGYPHEFLTLKADVLGPVPTSGEGVTSA